jgi:hypothetical protein
MFLQAKSEHITDKTMATKKTTSATGTSKAKATPKSKTAAKPKAASKVKAQSKTPTLEEIRKKAEEIYLDRISRGEPGSAEDDWLKAEEVLKGKSR